MRGSRWVGGARNRLCHLHALCLPVQPETRILPGHSGLSMRGGAAMNKVVSTVNKSVWIFLMGFLIAAADPRPLPESSLYQLSSRWATDDGREIGLSDLAGKARLITLFCGHSEASCPMALGRLQSLEAGLPKGWEKGAGMVLVTLDPGRDDSGSLAAFRRRMDLGRDGWILLRG